MRGSVFFLPEGPENFSVKAFRFILILQKTLQIVPILVYYICARNFL